ncbi:MAG: RidA family protein [Gammaproteobacteria bacterium]|nr:MAG: RidA family protein [Gammaproteobacteria bacterium]
MIERYRGRFLGRNKATAYKDLVWTVATAPDTSQDIAHQTREALHSIENNLVQAGSDKQSIVSAQVFIADMDDKPTMDTVWSEWIGDKPEHWPQRACLGVRLEGDVLVEVTVVAVRQKR